MIADGLASLTSSSTLQPSGSPRLLASFRAATLSSGVMTHPRPVLMMPIGTEVYGVVLILLLAICYLQCVCVWSMFECSYCNHPTCTVLCFWFVLAQHENRHEWPQQKRAPVLRSCHTKNTSLAGVSLKNLVKQFFKRAKNETISTCDNNYWQSDCIVSYPKTAK